MQFWGIIPAWNFNNMSLQNPMKKVTKSYRKLPTGQIINMLVKFLEQQLLWIQKYFGPTFCPN